MGVGAQEAGAGHIVGAQVYYWGQLVLLGELLHEGFVEKAVQAGVKALLGQAEKEFEAIATWGSEKQEQALVLLQALPDFSLAELAALEMIEVHYKTVDAGKVLLTAAGRVEMAADEVGQIALEAGVLPLVHSAYHAQALDLVGKRGLGLHYALMYPGEGHLLQLVVRASDAGAVL